jgi:hypothetical protein
MTSTPVKIHRAIGVAAALLLAACASLPPPDAELAQAAATLRQARDAGAAERAADVYAQSERKLALAREAMDARDARTARPLAEQALVDAELALARARAEAARDERDRKAAENARLRRELLGGGAP